MKKKIGNRGKQKKGTKVTCPKCKYSWKTNSKRGLICCSSCKRYFKSK